VISIIVKNGSKRIKKEKADQNSPSFLNIKVSHDDNEIGEEVLKVQHSYESECEEGDNNNTKIKAILLVPDSETGCENHNRRTFICAFDMFNYYKPNSKFF